MRNFPETAGPGSLQSRRKLEKTTNRPQVNNSDYERSVGYRLATEGSYTDMGASGTLQIWPKVSRETYQPLHDTEQKDPYHRSISDSTAHHRFRDDVPTLQSHHKTSRTPLPAPQHSSMASVRDMAHRMGYHTIHTATSQPNFHSAKPEPTRREGPNTSPKSSQSTRSQRLGLSRLFHSHSKEKEAKQAAKNKFESRISDRAQKDIDSYHVKTTVKPAEPQRPTTVQRSHKTVFERNPTEDAKVNVRRPPKGIKHWFDGVDVSDDDLPEVVQSTSEQVTSATFRPSLGPSRLRAAPTSRISPMAEPAQDYFQFSAAGGSRRDPRKTSAAQPGPSLHEYSVLNLSSSDDDECSGPPSPERWPKQSLEPSHTSSHGFHQGKSNEAAESIFSMQTMMTSGTIPIMNADSLYRTPLPPMPVPPQPSREDSAAAAPLRTQRSESVISRGRAPTTQSIPSSTRSDVSAATDSTTHVMTVTQEEMVLLEMMRRKRAEMHSDSPSPQHSAARHEQQHHPSRPTTFERQNSSSRSIASSTVSRNSDRSVLGRVFPAPPSIDRKSSTGRTPSTDRNFSGTDEKILAYVEEEVEYSKKSLPTTPEASICHELEAPLEHLPALTYGQTLFPPHKSSPSTTQKKKAASPAYNSADPYQLAPDLEFSPLDLLPLPARAYSPSLSTSRSSTGAGSQSSARTPTDGNSSTGLGLSVAGTELCELDVKRNSHVKGAGEDVLAAWSALGGVARC